MRTHIPVVVLDPTTGNAISGAQITVLNRVGGTTATLFTTESGVGTRAQPLITDSSGRVDAWVDRGSYTLNFTVPGMSPYTEFIDSAPASDGAIDTAWLAPLSVTAAKIANATITQTQMAANSIGTAQMIAGSVTNPILGANSVATGNIQGSSVTQALLASDVLPAGIIWLYGGAAAPTGWVLCQGQAINRTTFANLFAAIGTAYGVGDGSTTFNVPDYRGRGPVGLGTHTDVSTLGKTENPAIALASRKPRHRHGLGTLGMTTVGVHSHGGGTGGRNNTHTHGTGGFSGLLSTESSGSFWGAVAGGGPGSNNTYAIAQTGGESTDHGHGIGPDGGHAHTFTGVPGETSDGSGPLDSSTFQVANFIIKT